MTGAVGLLGRRHCRALAGAGARVFAVDLSADACLELARDLGRAGGEPAVGYACDITDPKALSGLTRAILDAAGTADVLVNNAAIDDKVEAPQPGRGTVPFEAYPLPSWEASLRVNLTGTFLCCQKLGSLMAHAGRGSIVNVASTYGIVGPDQSLYRETGGKQVFFKSAAYSATKGAVLALTRYLAAYWGEAGVRVNALTPGGVENGQGPDFIRRYAARTPLCRMARPDDYEGALVFLASDASSYMTGANLVVDGGFTAW